MTLLVRLVVLERKILPTLQLPSCEPLVHAGVRLNQYSPGPINRGVES